SNGIVLKSSSNTGCRDGFFGSSASLSRSAAFVVPKIPSNTSATAVGHCITHIAGTVPFRFLPREKGGFAQLCILAADLHRNSLSCTETLEWQAGQGQRRRSQSRTCTCHPCRRLGARRETPGMRFAIPIEANLDLPVVPGPALPPLPRTVANSPG